MSRPRWTIKGFNKIGLPALVALICFTLFIVQARANYLTALTDLKNQSLESLSSNMNSFISDVQNQIDKAQNLALLSQYSNLADMEAIANRLYSGDDDIIASWLITSGYKVVSADASNLSQTRLGTFLIDDDVHGDSIAKLFKTRRVLVTSTQSSSNPQSQRTTLECYIPIFSYENNLPKEIKGTIIISLNVDRLMGRSGLLKATRTHHIALFDNIHTELLFNTYSSTNSIESIASQSESLAIPLQIEDAFWTFYALPIEGWKPDLATPIILILSGLSLSILIFSYLHRLIHARDLLNAQVHERTLQLNESNQYLEQSYATLQEKQSELEMVNARLENSLDTLKATQDQLVRTEKLASLGKLVAGVAHEINTPLGIAVTASSFLRDQNSNVYGQFKENQLSRLAFSNFLEQSEEAFASLETALHRTADIVTSFKTVALDHSNMELKVINLKAFLSEVVNELSPQLELGQHHIAMRCPESIEILTFPVALSRILTNLVLNSVVHGFNDITGGSIAVDIEWNNGTICFHYTDNGHGIPNDLSERVFEPFFTTNRTKGCSGLGLHIVNNMVTQVLGGCILLHPNALANADNQGVHFEICFPTNTAL